MSDINTQQEKGSRSESSDRSILESMPQSSRLPTTLVGHRSKPDPKSPRAENRSNNLDDDDSTFQKWDAKDWDEEIFDGDERNSSLSLTIKISAQLSLLQQYLEIYKKFNVHLGRFASGPRHKGLLANIFSTTDHLESYTRRLRRLRDEKQLGSQEPSRMEVVATTISDRYKAREDKVWDLVEEKVDMSSVEEREAWLKKKGKVLNEVMGWTLAYLDEMDAMDEEWKEKEVKDMKLQWETRWKTYAAMDPEDLKAAGWILDV